MDRWRFIENMADWDLLPEYWHKMSKDELKDYYLNLDDTVVSKHFKAKKAMEEKLLKNPELKKRKLALFKIDYKKLNSIQKANYNFHKISGSLAEYGFNCVKLDNLWEEANIIATHFDGKQILRIRHKGRFTIYHKYKNKNLYIYYVENGISKLYYHDDAYKYAAHGDSNLTWQETGQVYIKTPKRYDPIITIL